MRDFYGINLLTTRDLFTNKEGELYCQAHCFDNNYIAIGYQTDGHPEIDTKEKYENFYKNNKSWQNLYNRFCGIKEGSFVWVKKDSRTYYLGKITDTEP